MSNYDIGVLIHHATPLINIIVGWLVLAFLLGIRANRLRVSPLVGYLAAGVLINPFTPCFVADTSLAPELAELGVILLMFGVGLHFFLKTFMAVKYLRHLGRYRANCGGDVARHGVSLGHGLTLLNGMVFGLYLSIASTVVLLRALEERQLIDSSRGQIAIGWFIVNGLVMVLMLMLMLLPAFGDILGTQRTGSAPAAHNSGTSWR